MLDRQQVAKFFDAGFVVQPDVFTDAEVAEMRAAFERLEAVATGLGTSREVNGSLFVVSPRASSVAARLPVRIHRVVWCGAAEPALSVFGRDPRLLGMAAALLGSRDMHQLVNQAHFKLPGDTVEFPWHQDSVHRRYGGAEWSDVNGRGSWIQTVTAIDRMTVDNGPLELIPGSAALGHMAPPAGVTGWLPLNRLDPAAATTVSMRPGSVLLFGPYVFHRSIANRSTTPRRVFVNGFASPGANARTYPGRGAGRLLRAPG
jgi:ectoine hydroxylase-related dioxygenase (phytanoyl-CoA dioxygenase family)